MTRQLVIAVLAGSVLCPAAGAANFSDNLRWSHTFTNGSPLNQGDPTTLRWSIVSDGQQIGGNGSDLIGYLDGIHGTSLGTDLTQRPWFSTIADQFDNLAAKTGIDFIYVADDGAAWSDGPASGGQGDIRLAGYDLPAIGQLGEAALPADGGDILLDTNNTSFADASTLGKVFQHELGHALGLLHVAVQGHSVLMNTSTLPSAGPQFDDLYALARLYGDPYETANGNDTLATAKPLGTLVPGATTIVGGDAVDQTVARTDTDFASIDGLGDVDYYRFEVTTPSELSLAVVPLGPAYSYTPEFLAPKFVDASRLSKLSLRLLDQTTGTPLATLDAGELGEGQQIDHFVLPRAGSYAVQVMGDRDDNQFYELQLVATPSSGADSSLVFIDRFGDETLDLNQQLPTATRQGGGNVTSPYLTSPITTVDGVPSAEVTGGRLQLSAQKGMPNQESAAVTLLRNFGTEVQGERWLLSFDLSIEASLTTDEAVFHFVMDDTWPVGPAMSEQAEVSLRLAADGDYRVVENGGNDSGDYFQLGNRQADSYRFQLLVDETFATPRVTMALDGQTIMPWNTVGLNSSERYFSFEATTLAGLMTGATVQTLIDNLSLVLLTDAIQGDYNLDGVVDLADYTMWRNQLGQTVLDGTAADGSGNGIIDLADYQVWKNHFGNWRQSNQVPATAVPEPGASGLLLLATMVFIDRYRVPLTRRRPPAA